ncbi:MAG: threonine synthase [Chitinophagales bacterium]|nr:threonine synthase [Chitinophagales bacterium]
MSFYSTNGGERNIRLKEALIQGQASDRGLYMPDRIPKLPSTFFKALPSLSMAEIAMEVSQAIFGKEVESTALKGICEKSMDFPVVLKQLDERIWVLELFHGPTLAFKDVGAKYMAALLGKLVEGDNQPITVLVATSGDTGSAVANAFYGIEGIQVIILYPSGKVSHIQEQQLTTFGGNVTAIEVDGTFDDCQAMVKAAFADKEITSKLRLTSANSINIARLIPQSFYYFFAKGQLEKKLQPIVSVPSGNFGNLTAGLMAKRMGLRVSRFLAATNANDIVPKYLINGKFEPKPSIPTLSNAMDVGNPSNFARMMDLYGHSVDRLSADLAGYSFTDAQTVETISEVYSTFGYIIEPHGAIGYRALKQYLNTHDDAKGFFLATAHPIKFKEAVEAAINVSPEMPERLKEVLHKTKQAILIKPKFEKLKSILLEEKIPQI